MRLDGYAKLDTATADDWQMTLDFLGTPAVRSTVWQEASHPTNTKPHRCLHIGVLHIIIPRRNDLRQDARMADFSLDEIDQRSMDHTRWICRQPAHDRVFGR